jgi:Armadillo/beta-catenin-like repeat
MSKFNVMQSDVSPTSQLTVPPHLSQYQFLHLDENKNKIARSTALGPLTRLARSKDIRVQRNATGALLNMTHSGTSTHELRVTY